MTTNATLTLHNGGFTTSYADLHTIPDAPRLGPDHYPVKHTDLIDAIIEGMGRFGWTPNIKDAKFGTNTSHSKFWGIIPVHDLTHPDWQTTIGLRNSTDQTFAMSGLAGSRVFICDNGVFRAEYRFNRKNTRNAWRDLPRQVDRFLNKVAIHDKQTNEDITLMQGREITGNERDHFIVESLRRNVFPATCVPTLLREIDNPSHECFSDESLWSLHNHYTEILKTRSPERMMQGSLKLSRMVAELLGERDPHDALAALDIEN